MSEGEFLAELRRLTKAGATWTIYPDDGGKTGVIRNIPTAHPAWGLCECPLTALHNNVFGGSLTTAGFSTAAWALGIPDKLRDQIVAAADGAPGHSEPLRKRILQACGLEK